MALWWIDGIKSDQDLIAALRHEAEEEISPSKAELLNYAATRLAALANGERQEGGDAASD